MIAAPRKAVGFFTEHGFTGRFSVGIASTLHDSNTNDYEPNQVVQYLNSGVLILFVPDMVNDAITNDGDAAGNSSIYTDGVWFWPNYLMHYVATHRISLPKQFVQHMEVRNWKPVSEAEIDIEKLGEFIEENAWSK